MTDALQEKSEGNQSYSGGKFTSGNTKFEVGMTSINRLPKQRDCPLTIKEMEANNGPI